jgi:hypothetical protein
MQTQWHVVFASEAKDALVRRLLPTLPEAALPAGQAALVGHAWQQWSDRSDLTAVSEELLARRREQQRLEGLGASTCTRAARPFHTAAPFPCRDSPCQRACGDDNDTVALAELKREAQRAGGGGMEELEARPGRADEHAPRPFARAIEPPLEQPLARARLFVRRG